MRDVVKEKKTKKKGTTTTREQPMTDISNPSIPIERPRVSHTSVDGCGGHQVYMLHPGQLFFFPWKKRAVLDVVDLFVVPLPSYLTHVRMYVLSITHSNVAGLLLNTQRRYLVCLCNIRRGLFLTECQ